MVCYTSNSLVPHSVLIRRTSTSGPRSCPSGASAAAPIRRTRVARGGGPPRCARFQNHL